MQKCSRFHFRCAEDFPFHSFPFPRLRGGEAKWDSLSTRGWELQKLLFKMSCNIFLVTKWQNATYRNHNEHNDHNDHNYGKIMAKWERIHRESDVFYERKGKFSALHTYTCRYCTIQFRVVPYFERVLLVRSIQWWCYTARPLWRSWEKGWRGRRGWRKLERGTSLSPDRRVIQSNSPIGSLRPSTSQEQLEQPEWDPL